MKRSASPTQAYSPKCLEGEFSEVRIAPVLCVIPGDRPYLSGGPGLLGPGLCALEAVLVGLRSCAELGEVPTGRLHERQRPAKPMVGAKGCFADLRASLA